MDLPARSRRYLLWITAFMVVLTTARYLKEPPRLTDDQTSNWWPVVNNLLDGKGFTQCLPEYFPFCTDDSPTDMREPLPLLAHAGVARLSGRSLWAASIFQAVLNIVVAWLIYFLARRLTSETTALVAAALWACYLPAYQDVINIAGDQLATLMLMLGALALERAVRKERRSGFLLAGIAFGCGMLCRSATVAFAVAAGTGVLFAKGLPRALRPIVQASVFAMGVAIALAPWVARNYVTFDRVMLGSTLSGYNLFRHNASLNGEHYCHFVAAEEGQAYLDSLIAAHPELTGQENEAEMNALYAAAGKSIIAAHPGRYVMLSAYRFLPLWTNWNVNKAYGKPLDMLDRLVFVLQVMLFLLALLALIRTPVRAGKVLLLGLALYSLMHMAVVARLRFLFPAMPMVVLLAAAGIVSFFRKRSAS